MKLGIAVVAIVLLGATMGILAPQHNPQLPDPVRVMQRPPMALVLQADGPSPNNCIPHWCGCDPLRPYCIYEHMGLGRANLAWLKHPLLDRMNELGLPPRT